MGDPMYVSSKRELPEPLYIAILDGRVQPTLALAPDITGEDRYRIGDCSDMPPGSSFMRGSSASSRCSASTSTTCSGFVDEPEASLAPWLIWCEGNFEKRKEQMEQMQALDGIASPKHFGSPSSFTRWYFEQSLGQVPKMGSVLVVGWREAKPCGAAIKAAMTGNMEGLRNDCTRPQLSQQLQGLVKMMIVLVDSPKQAKKVSEWIKSDAFLSETMQFRVIVNAVDLGKVLRQIILDTTC